jgi:hypothetical protein
MGMVPSTGLVRSMHAKSSTALHGGLWDAADPYTPAILAL